MSNINIVDKYEYSCNNNIIINKETEKIFPDDYSDGKFDAENLKVTPALLEDAFKKLTYVTFEVAQGCNLRCKYCVNNKHYSYQRGFSKKCMNFEVAKKRAGVLLGKDEKQ
jgi:sulfatase maturation enzyme AslB (radical SAM superfamily)